MAALLDKAQFFKAIIFGLQKKSHHFKENLIANLKSGIWRAFSKEILFHVQRQVSVKAVSFRTKKDVKFQVIGFSAFPRTLW